MASPHRRIVFAGAGLALVLIAGWMLLQVSRARCFALIGPVVCRVETRAPLVGLSFDDGPTPEGVAALLPVLRRYDAHATFFLIGWDIAEHPSTARALVAAGQSLGNHSYLHRRMYDLRPGPAEDEIVRTDRLLRQAGALPRLFRPPYGKKLAGLAIAVRRTGYRMVTWSIEEPETSDPRAYAAQVLAQVRPGAIILMHPMYRGNATARAALPLILGGLRQRGLTAVSIETLLAHAQPG